MIHMVSLTAQITGRRNGKEFLGAVGLRSTGLWMLTSHPSPFPHPSPAEAPSHLYFPAGVSSLSVSLQLPIVYQATSSGSPPSPHRARSYSSGVPEDHDQCPLVGNHTEVTAVSSSWRVGLSNWTKGYCFSQQPCQTVTPRMTLRKCVGGSATHIAATTLKMVARTATPLRMTPVPHHRPLTCTSRPHQRTGSSMLRLQKQPPGGHPTGPYLLGQSSRGQATGQ